MLLRDTAYSAGMGLIAKNGKEMPDHRRPEKITDRKGHEKTVWKGRKPLGNGSKGPGTSKRGLDDDRPAAPRNGKTGSLAAAFWGRVKVGYSNVQTIRENDREQRRLNDKPADMSDWNLYKARDLCREKRPSVVQAIKIARQTGDKKAEREAVKGLAALDKREEAVVAEIKMRRGPITRLVRRWQDRDWRTGKKLKGRKQSGRPGSGRSRTGAAATVSASASGGEHPWIDKMSHAMTSWIDGIFNFFENVAKSTKLRAESLKFW